MQKVKFTSVVIVAAGKGIRFSNTKNKVLDQINGLPIFEYSLEAFQRVDFVKQIVLVGPEFLKLSILKNKYSKLSDIVEGGESRQISVMNGLLKTRDDFSYVFIHDAARPFFTEQMIHDMWKTIETCDGVIPLLPIYDAIKEKNTEDEINPHSSNSLYRTQTPQLYNRSILLDAFRNKKDTLKQFRDEAELLKAYMKNLCIKGIPGNYLAEKITTQEDLTNLKKMIPATIKTGIGYDFHPYITGRELILGGCTIPYHLGLEGDSDGDVLSHSILDSLLGALSLGDIGRYIGVKCPSAMGAKSLGFLQTLLEDNRVPSFKILHIDTTLVCKEPLLNPWIENMIECLRRVLKINSNQINIKSTTDKGIDGAGEGRGIRAISIATIETYPRRDEWLTN